MPGGCGFVLQGEDIFIKSQGWQGFLHLLQKQQQSHHGGPSREVGAPLINEWCGSWGNIQTLPLEANWPVGPFSILTVQRVHRALAMHCSSRNRTYPTMVSIWVKGYFIECVICDASSTVMANIITPIRNSSLIKNFNFRLAWFLSLERNSIF